MATPEETIAELASQVVALGGQVSNLAGQLSAKDDQIGRLLVLVEKLNGKLDAALKLLEQRDPARAAKERESVNEALAGLPPRPEGAAEPPKPPPRPDRETTPRKRHAHGRTTAQPEHLTDTTTADRPTACDGCGGGRLRDVDEVVQSTWHYQRATWRYRRWVRATCQCVDCGARTTSEAPLLPFPRASCSVEAAAHVVHAKFGQHLPIDRQVREWAVQGVPLAKSTIIGWCRSVAGVLQPVCDHLWSNLLAADRLNMDGTGLLVLRGKGKAHRGQVYVFATDRIAVFKYFPTKHGERLDEALAKFGGTAVADAASNHDGLFADGERLEAGCNAHALRKFAEARASEPHIAGEGVRWLQAMYDAEAMAREQGLRGGALLEHRRRHIKPLLVDFRRWLELKVHETVPGTPEYKAIRYYLRHWRPLTRFVDEPDVPIDNNLAERLLKAVALGRKNFVFAGADVGAERAAVFYTVIETAKLNGVDPHAYLVWLLERLAYRREIRGVPIADLTPWRFKELSDKDQPQPG